MYRALIQSESRLLRVLRQLPFLFAGYRQLALKRRSIG